jgi:hypothetical protein
MITISSCAKNETENPKNEKDKPNIILDTEVPNRSYKLLFIGNSYTYVNDLPSLISSIAKDFNIKIEKDQSTPGGYHLFEHITNTNTLSKIESQKWDYVIIQDQSVTPSMPIDNLNGNIEYAVVPLANKIYDNNPNSTIMYYQTWGRRDGYTIVSDKVYEYDFKSHNKALREGYQRYADATNAEIAPIGDIWEKLYFDTKIPFIKTEMWSSDGSHPSAIGSYITAVCFATKLFNINPLNIKYNYNLKPEIANYIKESNSIYFNTKNQSKHN